MDKTYNNTALNYKFSQVFGYKGPHQKILEEDIISALKFDSSGNYIAIGDKAGRIIIFHNEQSKKGNKFYDYLTQFQSHINQFDPLRSLDVEEQIKGIEWLQSQGKYRKMVTANERTIKVWKFFEKSQKKVIKSSGKQLAIPKLQQIQSGFVAQPQKVFPNQHLTPLNTITKSYNEQFLLASDQSQILLWSFERPEKPYILFDMTKMKNGQQSDNITSSKYHPRNDNLFVYGTNKGLLEMGDLRTSSNVEGKCISFGNRFQQKNYLMELIARNSCVDFIRSGKHVISRDFLTVKIWDVCNPRKPLNIYNINDGLKPKLSQMTQNEAIYDSFFVSPSPNSNHLLTGSFSNWFHMINTEDGMNAQYQLNYKKSTIVREMSKGTQPVGKIDYVRKVHVGDFHPKNNTFAVGSLNCFFVYSM